MTSRKKIVLWMLLGFIVVIGVAAIVALSRLDAIVRSTVERKSTESLNVPTALASADVSILGGNVKLSNLNVASPAGFQGQMLSLASLNIDARVGELRENPVKVRSITVDQPKLIVEMKGTKFNIREFINAMPPGETDTTSDPVNLVIQSLSVRGAEVVFRPDTKAMSAIPGLADTLNMENEYVLPIPDFVMQNVGSGEGHENGVAIKQVITQMIGAMTQAAAQSDKLPPELRGLLGGNLDAIKDRLTGEAKKQLQEAVANITKDLSPEVRNITDQLLDDPLASTRPAELLDKVLGSDDKPTTKPEDLLEKGLEGLLKGKKK